MFSVFWLRVNKDSIIHSKARSFDIMKGAMFLVDNENIQLTSYVKIVDEILGNMLFKGTNLVILLFLLEHLPSLCYLELISMVKSVGLFNYYAILLLINVLLDPLFTGGYNHLVLEHAHQHNEPWRTKHWSSVVKFTRSVNTYNIMKHISLIILLRS